ncbi:MAG: hypothetical protein C4527_21380 [Candidatus Omnitrophota bacterium]|nr:MAG: hypothetical protein C4527_21380 [Candidatus Omnitrophota bacterium]
MFINTFVFEKNSKLLSSSGRLLFSRFPSFLESSIFEEKNILDFAFNHNKFTTEVKITLWFFYQK